MEHRLIYLHGFASSPGSNKARHFSHALEQRGVAVEIPDLNEGDFTGLTISRQLRLLERMTGAQAPGSVVLVGSSMGAYVAALFATGSESVASLVLMAPAFGFFQRWSERMSPEALAEWKRRGSFPVMHYGTDQTELIGYDLVEDARQYPAYPDVRVPALVIHGKNDESVEHRGSIEFAADRPNIELELLDSDHGLGDSVDWIIGRSFEFLSAWFPELGPSG